MPRVRIIFYTVIQTVHINANDTLRKELNLNVSPVLSPEKQIIFSVEAPEVERNTYDTLSTRFQCTVKKR